MLSLCFVDPFAFSNLRFDTIERLAKFRMDFLVLIPTGYDATRNEQTYRESDSPIVAAFLGNPTWKSQWEAERMKGASFDTFITKAFGASMERLGYIFSGPHETEKIRLPGKNVLLYRLALFSKSQLGAKLWEQAKKYATDQRSLF